jgi:hypothetical protein
MEGELNSNQCIGLGEPDADIAGIGVRILTISIIPKLIAFALDSPCIHCAGFHIIVLSSLGVPDMENRPLERSTRGRDERI